MDTFNLSLQYHSQTKDVFKTQGGICRGGDGEGMSYEMFLEGMGAA